MSRRREFAIELFSQYPPERFEYDPDTQMFAFDEETVPLADRAARRSPLKEPVDQVVAAGMLDTPNLFVQFGDTFYQFPGMYEVLKTFDSEKVSKIRGEVVESMVDAYAALAGTDRTVYFRGGSHMGFDMNFSRPGHPEFQVLGNCACLTVDPNGMFRHSAWEEGFAQFSWHNIDSVAQETALFAGAGALSRLCRIDAENSSIIA